jgi:hypothetical protein
MNSRFLFLLFSLALLALLTVSGASRTLEASGSAAVSGSRNLLVIPRGGVELKKYRAAKAVSKNNDAGDRAEDENGGDLDEDAGGVMEGDEEENENDNEENDAGEDNGVEEDQE